MVQDWVVWAGIVGLLVCFVAIVVTVVAAAVTNWGDPK